MYNQNNKNNFEQQTDFHKYFRNHQDNQYYNQQDTNKYNYQQTNYHINDVNSKLQQIVNDKLPQMKQLSKKDSQRIISIIQSLISQYSKVNSQRQKLVNQKRAIQQIKQQLQLKIDKTFRQKRNIQQQKDNIQYKLKLTQKNLRQITQQSQKQKQQLNKQIKQLSTRQKTFQAQFRKKDISIKNLQQSIRKFQQKNTFINTFQVIQKVQQGANVQYMYLTNGLNQYNKLARDSRQDIYRILCQQNKNLKDCLININNQLQSVVQLKKNTLYNKKMYDGQYDDKFDITQINGQTFNLPQFWSNQKMKQLTNNVTKFKQLMKLGQGIQSKIDDQRNSCIDGIKSILKNYKTAVQTQDKLINKVLIKSKQLNTTQINSIQSKYRNGKTQGQIDRAKRFIDQHSKYLQQKSNQIQKTRKLMANAVKKSMQSQKQISRQKQMFQKQSIDLRKAIQVIPSMLQQQLRKDNQLK